MQLADYAMIANSVPQDVKIKSVNEKKMEEQELATSALSNKAKEMQNQQTQSQLDYKNVLKGALQKNTKYNADGTSTTDHRAVANDVGQAGYIDEAHGYTLNQQKEIYATHKDQLQFISSLAQGVLSQPEAVREQAYQLAIAQAKNAGFDTSGAKPNYDENDLTGIINANITAKDFFDAPNKKMAAEANLLRAGAAEQNANSLSTRREALNNKLEIGSTQQPIASQGTLERIADMADAGMSLKDSPYAGLFTGSQNVANRNALAETITARATANGRDVADSLIALQDFRSGNKAAVVLADREAKIAPRVQEARNMIPMAKDLSAAYDRSSLRGMTLTENWLSKQTNDTNLSKLQAATNTFINAYDSAITGSTGGTVSGKDHAREMLNAAMDNASYQAVMNVMDKEMEFALQSPNQVKKMMDSHLKERTNKTKANTEKPNATSEKPNTLDHTSKSGNKIQFTVE